MRHCPHEPRSCGRSWRIAGRRPRPRPVKLRLAVDWRLRRWRGKQGRDEAAEAGQHIFAAEFAVGPEIRNGAVGAMDPNGSSGRIDYPNELHVGAKILVHLFLDLRVQVVGRHNLRSKIRIDSAVSFRFPSFGWNPVETNPPCATPSNSSALVLH